MSKSAETAHDLLAFIFNGTIIPWGSVTRLQVNLHRSEDSTEVYGGYSPLTFERSVQAITVTTEATNAVTFAFPKCTGSGGVITRVSVTPVGFDQVLYHGLLSEPLIVTAGIKPEFDPGTLIFTEVSA